jgi:drug/metabolite transporter (DMT)-like permease
VVQATGAVVVAAIVLARGEPLPTGEVAAYSVAAGLAGMIGLGAFYAALASGTMSIVAPISACGVALPVLVGVATGDEPSELQVVGLVVGFTGVLLASREAEREMIGEVPAPRSERRAIGLALLAALGFGCYFVAADGAARESVLWLLLLGRSASIAILAPLLVASRRVGLPRGPDLWQLGLIGLVDLAATALYALALREGMLSIVSVVGALYPVATVLLAWRILGERLRPDQRVGVALAFAGVACIAGGS